MSTNIPAELRERPQWVIWRFEKRDGTTTKVPYRAEGGGRADSTNPATWGTFEAALAGREARGADGIGYVFSKSDPFVGVDLDEGMSEADRGAIMVALDSYTETSVSGQGVHVIVRAGLNGRPRNRKGPFEVYEQGRYFAMTGQHLRGTPTTIEARQVELDKVLAHFLPAPEPIEHQRRVPQPVIADDRELIDRAMAACNGAEFSRLWDGDTSGYGSQSEADLALCSHLAFWTGGSPADIDRLFRNSGLMRNKWDERRSDSTWGAQTIDTAIAGKTEFYTPALHASPRRLRDVDGTAEPDLVGYQFTDLGNAHRFVAMYGGGFRYSREEKRWLEWRGGRWRRDLTGAVDRAAKAVVETLWKQVVDLPEAKRKEAATFAIACQSARRLRNMVELASTELDVVVTVDQLDTDPYLLACGNGTLDLRTGRLRDPDPADLITLGTDINYNPDAPRERWNVFIDEVFASDQDLIAFTKRGYGSCCTGDTRDRALLIEYGSRWNGKSTLNGAVQHVLGDFAHTAPIRVVMRTRQSEIPNEIAALARKRFVVVAETADGHKLDENRVKFLTGRDKVPARFLHHEWFEFTPEYKLFLYTNFKPKVDGSDGAIWDRIRLIPFQVVFDGDKEDKDLGAKLAAEAEGILAWLVEGCLEWQKNGLGSCAAVEQATASYRTENDTIGRFIAECCELGDDDRVERKTLRAALDQYCEETEDEKPPASTLGRWLTERGIREARVNGNRGYRGIRLREGIK